jgi:hypothetical protein
LLDPDGVLKTKLAEFVGRGDFGLASGPKPEGGYERLWYSEPVPADEVAFESGVVLLKKSKAVELKKKPLPPPPDDTVTPPPDDTVTPPPDDTVTPPPDDTVTPPPPAAKTIKLSGNVPPELWNRLGTRILPKLRTGKDLKIGINFSVIVEGANASDLQSELRQILDDLGLTDSVHLEQM